ncbi:MAG TPA: hypothetical protein VHY75_16930 [Steroidobacteraceae bacterium]|nr:hypothetical protein [Steroidobacteraceae bacterium]
MNILALIVVYKTRLDCSETLLTLSRQNSAGRLEVLVWDNSPHEASFAERAWLSAQFEHVSYRHDGQNTPLSALYNHVIERHLHHPVRKHDYLILLDQDSNLESAFLLKMSTAAVQHPDVNLLLPLVRAGADGRLVSPANLYYFRGSAWKRLRLGLIKSRFTTAINSGMMISVDYLTNGFPGYPPEIPFYGTDNWLCQSYAEKNRWIFVVDTTIKHDLAQFGDEPNDVRLWRHRQNIKALRFLNRRGFFRRNFCYLYTTGTCLRRAMRYRDWRFLR